MTNDLAHYHSILKNKGIVDNAEKILCEFLIVSQWQLSISHKTSALMLGLRDIRTTSAGPHSNERFVHSQRGPAEALSMVTPTPTAVTLGHLTASIGHPPRIACALRTRSFLRLRRHQGSSPRRTGAGVQWVSHEHAHVYLKRMLALPLMYVTSSEVDAWCLAELALSSTRWVGQGAARAH